MEWNNYFNHNNKKKNNKNTNKNETNEHMHVDNSRAFTAHVIDVSSHERSIKKTFLTQLMTVKTT